MKLGLIDILNDLGLNQTEQNGIFHKGTTTNFNDILGLFLIQLFANFKAENFESICPPQNDKSLTPLYPEFIPEPESLQSDNEKGSTLESKAPILFKLNSNSQMIKQLDAFISSQESKEVEVSPIFELNLSFLARGKEILKLLRDLSLKDEPDLSREIHEFIVREGNTKVNKGEEIGEFAISKKIEDEGVIIAPENLQNEIKLKPELVLKKSKDVKALKLEPSLREIAPENEVEIFKAWVGEILKEDDRINVEKPIFRSEKQQFQFKDQGHKADVKTGSGNVVLGNFENNRTGSEFDLQPEFKKFEFSSVKFGKVYEKVSNWNLSFIDALDIGDKANAGSSVISVKAKEIPDVVRALVFKNGDFTQGEVVLSVEPEEIGKVVVKISQGENGVKILFEVKNFEAKQLIESGFGNLKATLESSNVNLEKIGVLLISENPNGNYFDSSSSERGQFLKRTSKRKIFDSFETFKLYGGSLIEAII